MMNLLIPGWAKWAAMAVMVAGAYLFGRGDGKAIGQAELTEYKLELEQAKIAMLQAHGQIVTQTEIEYRDRIQVIKEKGETIVQQIPVFITAETNAHYPVSVGFVRLHDAAASGDTGITPGDSDGQAATVKASDAAETIAINYTECRKYAEQVTGWQAFYRELQVTTASYSP